MIADAEHFFDDDQSPDFFMTARGRRVYYWGPFRSKLSPAERGIAGLQPSLTGNFWSWIILDAESRHLLDGLIGRRNSESDSDRKARIAAAKEKGSIQREHLRAKSIRL